MLFSPSGCPCQVRYSLLFVRNDTQPLILCSIHVSGPPTRLWLCPCHEERCQLYRHGGMQMMLNITFFTQQHNTISSRLPQLVLSATSKLVALLEQYHHHHHLPPHRWPTNRLRHHLHQQTYGHRSYRCQTQFRNMHCIPLRT